MNVFLKELNERGLLFQSTADQQLDAHLQQPGRVGYCGFDPTADSLTIGNLIPINLLAHWQAAGHKPVAVMGGATGLIGDPSGKDEERQLRSPEEIRHNIAGQQKIIERLLDFDTAAPTAAVVINNYDWLKSLTYIEALRDVGKYFSVNAMIQKESVKARLESREQGISYTEFSYQILQAFDFYHLRNSINCTVQMAGSDQYGNIVAGIDLIHRKMGSDVEAYGVTAPLVTTADGRKIGKTEKGAIWLSADRTSPYQFYQFWINTDDADIANYLNWFTLMDRDEINALLQAHEQAPHERQPHRALAAHMTERLHGVDEQRRAESAAQALFSGDVHELDEQLLAEVFADVPSSDHDKAALEGEGVPLVELLPQTTLASSKREAREFLSSNAISVNGVRADDGIDARLRSRDLLHGRTILLRRGKKKWHATRWR